jgi:ABC-2 type transport system permease protein
MYPFNFITGVIGVAVVGLVNFVLIWVLTRNVPTVAGWDFYELVFLSSIFQVTHAFFILTFQQIRRIERVIRQGEFDRFLVRPLNPLFQYSTFSLTFAGFGDLLSGIIGLAYAAPHVTHWNTLSLAYLLIVMVSGATIQWSIYTLVGCIAFWSLQADGARTIINPFVFQFNQFPLTIYNKLIQVILTFILPIGFISFYPSSMFFGKEAEVPFSPFMVYAPPVVAFVMAWVTYKLWNLGINAYKGAGS